MLANKTLALFIAIFVILCGWFFLNTNSSYQLSFKAKFYYEIGEFKKAYDMSKQAYEIDVYNKMAFTILNQSSIALKLNDYINRGKEYIKKIKEISSKDVYKADKERIRLMCDIMIDDFYEVTKGITALTDKNLINDAKKTMNNFQRLKNEIFKD